MQDLEELSTEELQTLVDRARRIIAERKFIDKGHGPRVGVKTFFRKGATPYLLEYAKCGKQPQVGGARRWHGERFVLGSVPLLLTRSSG